MALAARGGIRVAAISALAELGIRGEVRHDRGSQRLMRENLY